MSGGARGSGLRRGGPGGFIPTHAVMWEGGDTDHAVPVVRAAPARFPNLRAVSLHRGFHSPANRALLDGLPVVNALPKKGCLGKVDRERGSEREFASMRKKHPGVESRTTNLGHRGLDLVRARGAARAVSLSVIAPTCTGSGPSCARGRGSGADAPPLRARRLYMEYSMYKRFRDSAGRPPRRCPGAGIGQKPEPGRAKTGGFLADTKYVLSECFSMMYPSHSFRPPGSGWAFRGWNPARPATPTANSRMVVRPGGGRARMTRSARRRTYRMQPQSSVTKSVAGASGRSRASRWRWRTRQAVIASKARHLRRSSARAARVTRAAPIPGCAVRFRRADPPPRAAVPTVRPASLGRVAMCSHRSVRPPVPESTLRRAGRPARTGNVCRGPSAALRGSSQKSPSRSRTETTRASGQASAGSPDRSRPRSQRALPVSSLPRKSAVGPNTPSARPAVPGPARHGARDPRHPRRRPSGETGPPVARSV